MRVINFLHKLFQISVGIRTKTGHTEAFLQKSPKISGEICTKSGGNCIKSGGICTKSGCFPRLLWPSTSKITSNRLTAFPTRDLCRKCKKVEAEILCITKHLYGVKNLYVTKNRPLIEGPASYQQQNEDSDCFIMIPKHSVLRGLTTGFVTDCYNHV